MAKQDNYWKDLISKSAGLDTPDKISEITTGLLMVISITGTISVSTAGNNDVKDLLWAAIGCNTAWGLIDAISSLMGTIIERERNITQGIKIREGASQDASREIVRDNLSPLLSELMNDDEVDKLAEELKQLPAPDKKNSLTLKDFLIGGQIFLLVFLSTFPVVLPFVFFKDVHEAMRVSNGIVILLLFVAGYALGKYSGLKPFLTALFFTAIGVFLSAIIIILGG
jgi:VIT1/CCC1 family predicted Fe2+/Mn2+ transporter